MFRFIDLSEVMYEVVVFPPIPFSKSNYLAGLIVSQIVYINIILI